MARDFNVRSQATKLGISADGVIQFHSAYGEADPGGVTALLQTLAQGG